MDRTDRTVRCDVRPYPKLPPRRTVGAAMRRAILALLAVLLAACGPAASPSATATPAAPGTVNVAREAGLSGSLWIEVYAMTEGGYLFRTAIADRAQVDAVVGALDQPVALQPRVRCPDRYHLHFVAAGGSRAVLGLVCADQPDVIRGAQPFWRDRDAPLPEAAGRVIADVLAGSSPPAPLASDAVVQQVVADLVSSVSGADAHAAYDWRRVDLNPGVLLGQPERWLYASTEWVVVVEWLPAPSPVYAVTVAVPSLGLAWHGRGPAGAIVQE